MSLLDITALSLVEILGDFSLEKFAHGGGTCFLGIGGLSYAGVVYFLVRSLKNSSILFVNNAWDGISSLIESIAAMVLLGERFGSIWQYVGIGLIVCGLFLIKYTGSGSAYLTIKECAK